MIPTMRCWQNLPNVASHVRCHMQMLQTQKCSFLGLRKLRGYVGCRTQLLQVQKSTYVGLHRPCRDSASSVQWGLPTSKELSSSFSSASTSSSSTASSPRKEPALLECSDKQTRTVAERDFSVIPDFVTEAEEGLLLKEVERFLKKVRYEYDHWDNAIHGFRETEKSRWSDDNGLIIQRIRDVAFPSSSHQLSLVHVLDLAPNGYIKPHVDSIKFCGPTIAGLSLLSPAIMRLVHTDDSSRWVNVLLRPRSLYIMRDSIRYDFTHEVLKDEESVFKGEPVKRGRRISIMCRNEAPST